MKSLKVKIVGGFILITLICMIFSALIALREIKDISVNYMDKEGKKLSEQIKKDIELTGVSDIKSVQNYIESAQKQNDGIDYIALIDRNYKAVAHSSKNRIGIVTRDKFREEAFSSGKVQGYILKRKEAKTVYDVLTPVTEGNKVTCLISVGMSMDEMNSEIRKAFISVILFGFPISSAAIFAGIAMSLFIAKPIVRIINDIDRFSRGDLSVEFNDNSSSEMNALAESMNRAVCGIRGVVSDIKNTADELQKASDMIGSSCMEASGASLSVAEASSDVSDRICEQTEEISEINRLMEEFALRIDKVHDKLEVVDMKSQNIKTEADGGTERIRTLLAKLSEIQSSFGDVTERIERFTGEIALIKNVTAVIKSVASQTNLLALNAAIEAARVGNEGAGFAVVAEEIKKLADEVLEHSRKINEQIDFIGGQSAELYSNSSNVYKDINFQVSDMENTIETFEVIMRDTGEISPAVDKVMTELVAVIGDKENVAANIYNVSKTSEEISASTEEIRASLAQQNNLMEGFKELTAELLKTQQHLAYDVDKFIL